MSAAPSAIPAAVAALIAAFAGRPELVGVNVVDGPPLRWGDVKLDGDSVSQARYLFVGATPEGPAISSTQEYRAAGAVARMETASISCAALSWAGAGDMATVRADAFGIVAGAELAIRADVQLGGAVLDSLFAGVDSADQRRGRRGSSVLVLFTVRFRAYLQ